ncbi:MAG: hypothetical protein ACE5FC_11475, partial [Myxococcota bacterium]
APMAASHFSATAYVIGEDPTSLDVFRRQILRLRRLLAERGLRDRRLMITEFGVAHGRVDEQRVRDFLDATTRFLNSATDPDIGCSNDSDRLVQRWAWFTAHPLGPLEKLQRLGLGSFRVRLGQTSLFDRNGELNALGLAYRRAVWRARGATPKEALHESPTTRNTRAGKG